MAYTESFLTFYIFFIYGFCLQCIIFFCNSFFFINVIASFAGFWSKIIGYEYMKAGLPQHGWSLTMPFLIMPQKNEEETSWSEKREARKGREKAMSVEKCKNLQPFIHNPVPAFSRASSPPNYGINTKPLLKPIYIF